MKERRQSMGTVAASLPVPGQAQMGAVIGAPLMRYSVKRMWR